MAAKTIINTTIFPQKPHTLKSLANTCKSLTDGTLQMLPGEQS